MNKPRVVVLAGLIAAVAAARLIPHAPNFSPVAAIALFGGASLGDKRLAFLVPLAALFVSDLVLGFYPGIVSVYGAFAAIVAIGFWLRRHRSAPAVVGASLAGSCLFFVVTNFAVWAGGTLYPHTGAGLATCYAAAIPFFRNTVAGDLLYAGVLFGGFALVEKRFPVLRELTTSA